MNNPYDYLKVDGRRELPQPWQDYPVLKDRKFHTTSVWQDNDSHQHIQIHIGEQDGVWVVGYSYNIGNSGGCCLPGRKWGEFTTERHARLWALGEMLTIDTPDNPLPRVVFHAIHDQIFHIAQLSLF